MTDDKQERVNVPLTLFELQLITAMIDGEHAFQTIRVQHEQDYRRRVLASETCSELKRLQHQIDGARATALARRGAVQGG